MRFTANETASKRAALWFASGVVAAALGAAGGALAQEDGSTSESGASVGMTAFGGQVDGTRAAGGRLTVTTPIVGDIGAQVNALVGGVENDALTSTSAHLFYHDPDFGLFGVFGGVAYITDDDLDEDFVRVGFEGQLYLGDFTLSGAAAYTEGAVLTEGAGGSGELYVRGDVDYFVTDDLMLSAGYRLLNDRSFGAAGLEYQLVAAEQVGFSLLVDARVADSDTYGAFGGGRLYFGGPRPLIDRHRIDEPGLSTPFDDVLDLSSRR